MITRTFLCAATLAAVSLPIAAAAMPPAEAWQIGPIVRGQNYSVGMPTQPEAANGGISIAFPQNGEVDALTTAIGPLASARQITFRYRVDAPRGAGLVPSERPDQAPTVSIYFQQRGDNWSGRGRYASYRWYVPARGVMPLTPGEHSVTIRLDEAWTNVNGQPNVADPDGFAQALENASQLGVAFGTSSARSHGVYATGPARFTLLGLDID